MIPGSGTISDYGSYISNCTLSQKPYRIPVNSLADVQLFINIGVVKPTTVQYDIIHTCGPLAGTVESITPSSYVIGQNPSNSWYGVFKDFSGANPTCFVISITLDSTIYFSEEYCVENCRPLTLIEGCYGNLDNRLSTDCEGVYFGTHAGSGEPLGDTSVKYEHKLLLRDVNVFLTALKNSFKQGRTRSFRTEKEKIYQFEIAETIPEWYLSDIDAIFYRGEVKIGGVNYLLNETQFENVEPCFRQWKANATFKESCYQSFSCETDPCATPAEECCDPVVLSVTVQEVEEESGESGFVPPPSPSTTRTIVIQAVIDDTPDVTGTDNVPTGLTDGSTVVTLSDFENVRVNVWRGNLLLPGIDPLDGGSYYTKVLADDFITFSSPLVNGEFVRIETIPR